jgi:hypothetical protein
MKPHFIFTLIHFNLFVNLCEFLLKKNPHENAERGDKEKEEIK